MKSRKWLIGLLAAIVVIAAGVSIALVGLSPSSPDEEVQAGQLISAEEAMESIRQFENTSLPDLELTRMPDYPLDGCIELRSGNTTYEVNPETAAVEMAFYADNFSGMEVVLSMETAQEAAADFAEQHYPAFTSLTLDESEFLDHGAGGKEYTFTWIEFLDGVPTPNQVFVTVDPATGKVVTYVAKHQLIESFDSPSVSLEKAREIAEDTYSRETGVKDLTVGESLLGEHVLQVILVDGEQHLAWTVEVRETSTDDGIEMGALFFIDAHTEAVLQIVGF